MSEAKIQSEILRAVGGRPDVRLFRNNTGQAWVGRFLQRFPDGSVLIGNARAFHAGLHAGSADLIGIHHGRFLSIECKSPSGHASPEQIRWRDMVTAQGGIAGICHSVAEAEKLLL